MTVQPRSRALPLSRPIETAESRAAGLAQRRAWLYIWAAFTIWCVLVASAGYALNSWRKTTYWAPPAQLLSKRGIVLYQGPRDERPISIGEGTDLEEGGLLDVPASSEAMLQLRVDNSTIRLRPSSTIKLTSMRVGRFSRELTQVRVEQSRGAANYTVAGELPDGRELEVRTPDTPQAPDSLKLTKGEYLVWVQPGGTRLASYTGQAKADVGSSVFRLRDGKWIVLGQDRPDLRQALDLPEHLLKNRDFSRGAGYTWSTIDVGEKGRPDVGGQRTVVEELVNGQPMRALRIRRETTKDTHNETGLSQEVNREVSAYRAVTLSTWVKVNGASLDGGGYAGSEYPMMLRVNYVAENGGTYAWTHGFYTKNPTNRPADLGEQIPAGEWYRYVLDMTALRERPAYIIGVEVFAAGHDFDAEVAGVDLTVE
jgi:hypothetical protein